MKNKFITFILLLCILIITMGAISATDVSDNGTVAADENNNALEISSEDVLTDNPKTITVPFDPRNPNEVLLPKIQPAIDSANPGDTIIIEGNPVHCHLTINKKLNIVAGYETTIDACPHHTHDGLTQHGVFYITSEGSGSTIQGFTFINKDKAETPFAILIDGATDITIKDCTLNYSNPNADKLSGIIIKNSNNVHLSNLIVNNTINGITIINSENVDITDSVIGYNENQAIAISGTSKNIYINKNQIVNNGNYGINLSSANNINILNNLIKDNGNSNTDSGSGIYVNTNITKLVVKGNVFLSNNLHAIMYDYRTRNLNDDEGADQLTIVDNNYFSGHNSMVLHHRIYIEYANGDMKYDAENDVYGSAGNGSYIEQKSYSYLQHALINSEMLCGFTYYAPSIPWAIDARGNNGKYNLSLALSINQVKNGVYQAAIIDSAGNVASDFNFFYVTFFLNDYTNVEPNQNNVYKKVLIKNGVATADFRDIFTSFKSSGNVVTAVIPGIFEEVDRNIHAQFAIKNSDIPINPKTSLIATKLTTYPLSDSYFNVKLVDSKGKIIPNKVISFKINGKVYSAKTNNKGIAKIKVSLISKKTYAVTLNFKGDDDYKSSKTTGKIILKTGSKKAKIKSSNMKMKKNKKKSFKIKLTSSAGKALKNQKVIVKVNGKTSIIKTNKKGIAKIALKLKKAKTYKISTKFLGNSDFKSASKINKIIVS